MGCNGRDDRWLRHYEPGVPPSLDYERLTLCDWLDRSVARFGDTTAVIFGNGRMSYRELGREVDRLATGLAALGVERGHRVAIHLPNLPQTVIAHFAVLRLGGVVVMTNPMSVAREIEEQWNDAGVRLAITCDFLFERHVAGLRGRTPVGHVVVASIPEYLRFPLKQLAPLALRRQDPPVYAKVAYGPGVSSFARLVAAHPPRPPAARPAWGDLAVLQYTGGTTGRSKAAMLTHANLSSNVQQTRIWFTDLDEGHEVFLTALPLFHVFGMTVCMHLGLAVGGTLVLMANPRHTARLADAIARHQVTRFPAVPTMYGAINALPNVGKLDLSSVKSCLSGSAPLAEETQRRFEELTGGRIVEGFGLTESSPVTHVNPLRGLRKIGSIGVPVSDTEVRLADLDDAGRDAAPGEAGELLVRGPQVMAGYWKRPAETAEALRDGWLHTGDLATVDDDGFFRIVGRKKDMIVCGGYNVYPDEIDRLLHEHPAVAEACTIGVPDAHRGETVKTFVVLAPGAEDDPRATEEELIAWCRERLAAYKVPRSVEFRDELPRSAVLKLLRRELREQEAKRPA